MEQKVKRFISDSNLLEDGDRVVVGVSGGADSVCLLYLLHSFARVYNLTLYVVHVNHEIRGKDSDEDEAYVGELCTKLCLHFHAYHYDVCKIASEKGISTEEAGRNVRYESFNQECVKYNCNKVAVAHNQNDTAETVFFHLIRGTGIRGLTGIPASRTLGNSVTLIRPILCLSRREIEEYLKHKKILFRTDLTNFSDDYSRNKIRNKVFPYVKKELNEGVIKHIASAAAQLEEISKYVDGNIEVAYNKYVQTNGLNLGCFLSDEAQIEDIVIQKGIIRKILEGMLWQGLKDVELCHIDSILDLFKRQVGKQINLPGIIIVKQYNDLLFLAQEQLDMKQSQIKIVPRMIDIHGSKTYYLPEIGKTLEVYVKEYKKNMMIPKNGYTKWFDYDKINNTVFLRTRRQGDYIQVTHTGGTKKIKDYFINQKIPQKERDYYPIIADGNHVMWIIGDRISEGYKISEQTKTILEISLIGGNEYER